MANDKPNKLKRSRKRFWILTFTLLASMASFAFSFAGVIANTTRVIGGMTLFALSPLAGEEIISDVGKANAAGDDFITITAVLGCLLLGLFFVLFKKLK